MEEDFTLWLIKKKAANKIFVIGSLFGFIGYTMWRPIGNIFHLSEEKSYQVYFSCIAISLFFYTFAYFLTKYDKWRWYPMFVTLICFSRVIQEIFYPELNQNYVWLEYLNFILTFFLVVFYYIKYKNDEFKKEKNELSKKVSKKI